MVISEDGTKWACQSCLKGHRVSGCTHTDRELTLVPKKGRPVTQCQHCRTERKKRSAHVKCDCGEAEKPHHPKEKCIHLREAEERAKAGITDDHHEKEDAHHLISVAEEQGCCCHHGGKCSCSLIKKEPPSQDGTPHGPAVPKPRLETTRSDGSITVFANGHHKPVHKRNHAAHECGMPYKMPMARAHTEHSVSAQARRSVDSLALDSNVSWNPASFAPQPRPLFNTDRRMSKSEETSPRPSAVDAIGTCSGGPSGAKLSTIDFSTLGPIQTNQSLDSATSESMFNTALDPMSGVMDGSFDPWSTFPSADSSLPNNNPFGVWATNFDASNVAQPALTAASSGTQSEVDEIPTMDDFHGFGMPSIQEDMGAFDLVDVPDDNINTNRHSLPPSFFGNPNFSMPSVLNEWQTPVGSVHGSESGKSKGVANDPSLGFVDSWQTPTMPSMSGVPPRSTAVTANPGRPTSQSPGEAQGDDVMKQLFPDIDIDHHAYGLGDSPTTTDYATLHRIGGLKSSPVDMSSLDDNMGFTSQPWSDGSLTVPHDTFPNSYDPDDNFSSQDLMNWPYQ